MYDLAAAGKGVILSDNFAQLQGLHYGDTIDARDAAPACT